MRTTATLNRTLSAPAPAGARHFTDLLVELPWTVFETLCRWQGRAESRRRLAELDDRLLADIGADREDLAAEAAKPFWKA